MAKKAQAAATEATATETAPVWGEIITGTLELYSVEADEDGNPIDQKTLTIAKGKELEKGAIRYQATCDGAKGKIAASISAAINDLLEKGLKVLPAAWAVPKNEQEVKFPQKGDNKPKEPETIDDLNPAMAEAMREQMSDLASEVAAYTDAETRTRTIVRKVAITVAGLRKQYSKPEWAIFARLADPASDVAKLLTAKNTLGEFVFFANIPDALFDIMPKSKASPKTAQAWINSIRATIAHTIVDVIKANAELAAMAATEAFRKVVADHFNGEEPLSFDEQDAANALLDLHYGNLPVGSLFEVLGDGKLAPAREDGKHVTSSLFGSEGADELVKAMASAFNSYQSADEKAAVADMKARAKGVVSKDFNSLSPDAVALHLFNILAGRVNAETDESLESTVQDCLAVVDKLGGWFDAIAAGTMTVADVLAANTPKTEEDAEADADAEA